MSKPTRLCRLSIISNILGSCFSGFRSKKLLNVLDQIQGWFCRWLKAFITYAGSFCILESGRWPKVSASPAHNLSCSGKFSVG